MLIEINIRRVKLSSRDRFAVRTVLVFMLAATICCIVKTTLILPVLTSHDSTYDSIPLSILGVAEAYTALSAACLPAVRLLAGRYFPHHLRFWRQSAHSRTGTVGGTAMSATMRSRHDINKTETVRIEEEIVTPERMASDTREFAHKDDEKMGWISHASVAEIRSNAV